MCGLNETKIEVMGKMFVRHKLDVLALSEMKMKGKGEGGRGRGREREREFGSVLGRVSGVDGGRGREEVGKSTFPCKTTVQLLANLVHLLH